jgi:tetratricopeptide (TPR) repeat protein
LAGHVRELSHVMERITLLHVGAEIDAATLTRLCLLLAAPQPSARIALRPQEPAPEDTLPAEAVQIRQALAQTGGNVARAARLLGLSRDTVRYRMQRFGIDRPHLAAPSPSTTSCSPGVGNGGSSPRRDALPPEAPLALTSPFVQKEATPSQRSARHDVPTERHVPTPEPASEHTPVAVLALDLTWPEVPDLESLHYDPWTEQTRWEQAIMDKVYGFGGMLVGHTASRLVWVFGVPQMLEQLPQRAVHSALAIRQSVMESDTPNRRPYPTVRLSVHLGAVRVDPQASDPAAQVQVVGETLALPVRLLGQAAPGTIVVSPEVGRLVDGWVALETRPQRAVDPTRVRAYTVVGVSPGRGASARRRRPTQSPFVGREREQMLLGAIFEQVEVGRGQVVSLVGPPGMGKSRLLEEFCQRRIGPRVRYAEGHCLAYGSMVPYLPVLDLLREYCGVAADDGPEALISKVGASLQQAGLEPEASLPYLLSLLGVPVTADPLAHLSAETRKTQTFEAIRQLFLGSSRHHPVLLAVENLHWIDPTSEALLASLVDALAGAAILLLATFRPGYRPRWLDKSYATQIALQPLGLEESRQVVRCVLRDTAVTPALEQQLLARAEGNPFFLEELAFTVREHGEEGSALSVPDTIHAVLAARMDRLPTPERHLLQAASVIGKGIPVPLLQAMTALSEETLSRHLAQLQAAEFLSAAGHPPTSNYTFRHILIQETAYQALLTSTRRQYHQQIAQALAAHFPALAAAQPALLAHHYTQASCTEQAIAAWQRAGQQAAERSAHVEAIAHFTQALALLQTLPATPERSQQELELQLALGPSVVATRGPAAPEAAQTYGRARALCTQIGDTPQLFPTLWGLWRFYRSRGELPTARELGEHLLRLAQREASPTHLLEAHAALGDTFFVRGEYAAARTHLEQGIACTDPAEQRAQALRHGVAPGVTCLAYATLTLWCLGYPAQALRRSQETLVLAQALGHPHSLAFTQQWVVALHHRRREVSAVEAQADALFTLATAQGFPL